MLPMWPNVAERLADLDHWGGKSVFLFCCGCFLLRVRGAFVFCCGCFRVRGRFFFAAGAWARFFFSVAGAVGARFSLLRARSVFAVFSRLYYENLYFHYILIGKPLSSLYFIFCENL